MNHRPFSIGRRLAAESLGTILLIMTVVGSGIMAESLAEGNKALALLANALATVGILYVLITILGPVSGAHFNPIVTMVSCPRREISWREGVLYAFTQCLAALGGIVFVHAMFGLPLFQLSDQSRTDTGLWLSEGIASFGLVSVILFTARHKSDQIATIVAAFIGAAYWFTASTAFSNPALTFARAFTDSFAGIDLKDVPAFVVSQTFGAYVALKVFDWFHKPSS